MTLSWSASTDDVGVTGYRLFRDGSAGRHRHRRPASASRASPARRPTRSASPRSMPPATSPAPPRRASRRTACLPRDTTPPSTPTGLVTERRRSDLVTLSWTASTDDVGVTGYRCSATAAQVGTPTAHELQLHRARPAARPTRSASPPSMRQATSPAPPRRTSRPLPVRTRRRRRRRQGSRRARSAQTSATLSWTASTDDVGVTGYRLFQGGTQVGTSATDELRLHRADLRDDLHAGRRRRRRRRQRLRHRHQERHDRCLPGHHPAVHADGARHERGRARPRRPCRGRPRPTTSASPATGCSRAARRSGPRRRRASATPASPAARPTRSASPLSMPPATSPAPQRRASPRLPARTRRHRPPRPGSATSAVGPTSATLSWTASTDNVAVTGYRLFQGGSQVGTSATTSFAYTGLTCATTYTLGVAAVDAAGNVSGTATKSLTTAACPDTTPPSTPTGLATSAVAADLRDAVVDGLDRQRRRHRLPRCSVTARRSAPRRRRASASPA